MTPRPPVANPTGGTGERVNPFNSNFFQKGPAMKTIKKILSRLRDMFHKKQTKTTKTIPLFSSTFTNTLYGTVVPAKPAPHFFMVCHRPGEGKTVSIVPAPNSMTLFP